jgi:hypothetical protein
LKISIIYTVLGVLVVLSVVLFSGMIESGYWYSQGNDGVYGVISNGNPGANTAMRNWILCYAGLGVAVLAAGIVSFFLKSRIYKVWLALVQTVLGGLVMVSLVVFMLWVEPNWASYTKVSDYTGNLIVMSHDSGWVIKQIIWKAAGILVGLGVAGTGFMQWRRLRKRY